MVWEHNLIEWIQALIGNTPVMSIVSAVSFFGEEIIIIAILGFFYWGYDKEIGKSIGITVLLANCLNPMIKNVFLRKRPYFNDSNIKLYRKIDRSADVFDVEAQGYSFPSGHSTNAVSVYGSLAYYKKNKVLKILAIILPLIVGFSRISVGAHYPTDVICGFILGAFVLFMVPFLRSRIKNKIALYVLFFVIVIPGVFYCKSEDYFTSLGLVLAFMISDIFEERFVKFENTKSPLEIAIRMLGGVVVYVVLNFVLKLPFSKEFLDSGILAANLVRTARYLVILFVDLAIYPMVFRYIHIGKKTSKNVK